MYHYKNIIKGFVAKPITKEDGTTDMLKWQCEIPGPVGVNNLIYFLVRLGRRNLYLVYGLCS